MKIKEFQENTEIKEKLFVTNAVKGITNKSAPYLNITFQDSSGQIEGRKWTVLAEDDEIFAKGNIVEVTGQVIKYSSTLQLKVLSGIKIDITADEAYDYAPASPVDRRSLQKELIRYIGEISDQQIKKVVEKIVNDNISSLWIFPAAVKNHHEYISGLAEHTVGMLHSAEAISKVYPQLNKNYLYAGVILHDLGKIIELGDALAPHYTMAGKMIGHISIMQARISEVCHELEIDEETSIILEHLVLAHHGQKEYGSPILPLLREAEVLYIIDNLDARMNMIDKALKDTVEGEFSARIPGLDNRSFYKPKNK